MIQGGQLSRADFDAALRLFAAWWAQHCADQPAWRVVAVPAPVTQQVLCYALLERTVPAGGAGSSDGRGSARSSCPLPAAPQPAAQSPRQLQAGEDDDAVLQELPASQQQQQQHVHEYSICYHETYRVPVLHLRGFKPDGQPLSLAQLMLDLPALQQWQPERCEQRWTFITATEHPLTRAPGFMLHPCQTAACMDLLLAGLAEPGCEAGAQPDERRLLAYAGGWASLIAPLLGLAFHGVVPQVAPGPPRD